MSRLGSSPALLGPGAQSAEACPLPSGALPRRYWGALAARGAPVQESLPAWPEFGQDGGLGLGGRYLRLLAAPEAGSGLGEADCALWDDLLLSSSGGGGAGRHAEQLGGLLQTS